MSALMFWLSIAAYVVLGAFIARRTYVSAKLDFRRRYAEAEANPEYRWVGDVFHERKERIYPSDWSDVRAGWVLLTWPLVVTARGIRWFFVSAVEKHDAAEKKRLAEEQERTTFWRDQYRLSEEGTPEREIAQQVLVSMGEEL